MKKIVITIVPLIISLFIASSLWGITPIHEDFRFLDQSYTYSETTPSGRKIEEIKHFSLNETTGMISERTVTYIDGEPSGRERAWWFTDEIYNNHFRVALLPNGNLWVFAMGRVSSGYKGAGMNEAEVGTIYATELNYNTGSYGRLRVSSGPLVGRGFVNDSMFFRKTWRRTELDRETFIQKFRAAGGDNIELAEEMKFLDPFLGVWEGNDNEGRKHRNMFTRQSPSWVLEFWRIGEEDEDGPRGVNIIGTDTLRGGNISLSSISSRGYSRFAGRYEAVQPGTAIQFQGNNYLIRKVSGDTMTVTWKSLEGTEYVETRKYQLKRATN